MADMTFRQKKMKSAAGPHNLQRDDHSGNEYEQMHGANEFFVVGDSYGSKCKDRGEPGDQTTPALNKEAGYNESQLKALAKILSEGGLEDRNKYRFDPKLGKMVGPRGEDVGTQSSREQQGMTPEFKQLMIAYDLEVKNLAERYGPAAQALYMHATTNMKYSNWAERALKKGFAPAEVARVVIDAIFEREGNEEPKELPKQELGAPKGAKQVDPTDLAKTFAQTARAQRRGRG